MTPVARLARTDLTEITEWAEQVVEDANDWALRAERSRRHAELRQALDGLASTAERARSLAEVIARR